jgi:ABC-type branched-subunit amino acid transport system permease subunit
VNNYAVAALVERLRTSVVTAPTASVINAVGAIVVVVAAVAAAQRIYEGGSTYFLQTMGFGLAQGSIFALVALGYTMVYGIIELINFAHGDVFTLGAFFSLALMPAFGLVEGKVSGLALVLPLLGLFVATMLFCGVVNVVIERVAYRPLRHAPRLAPLITAIGMSALLEGIMFVWKGPFNLHYPDFLPETQVTIAPGVTVAAKALMAFEARQGHARDSAGQRRRAADGHRHQPHHLRHVLHWRRARRRRRHHLRPLLQLRRGL